MQLKSWILRRSVGTPSLRLYCFCYAGGSAASFLSWQAEVDPAIEICGVQLPGRGARFHELPYTKLSELITVLSHVIERDSTLPFAFFGHSLGGLLAFELARYNAKHGRSLPGHLIISGCAAARYRFPSEKLHLLDDKAFAKRLRKYNGTPPEVLENPELMELVLPTIRADFALVDNYEYVPGAALNIPITVLAGKGEQFTSSAQTAGWQEETLGACDVHWVDGDHFFINSNRKAVIDRINAVLKSHVGGQRLRAPTLFRSIA